MGFFARLTTKRRLWQARCAGCSTAPSSELALHEAEKRGAIRVGVVGLGIGTLASYGRPGEHYIFYEINPLVSRLANTEFSFQRDSEGRIGVIPGDARLALERQPPQALTCSSWAPSWAAPFQSISSLKRLSPVFPPPQSEWRTGGRCCQ